MSIQSETYSPEHMRSEKEGWTKWVIGTIALGIFTFCALIAVSPLIYWASETTFNQNSWAEASAYLARIGEPNFIAEAHNARSEEHTSELQSLMRISYAVFCLKTKNRQPRHYTHHVRHIK